MENKYLKIAGLIALFVMVLFAVPYIFNWFMPFIIAAVVATAFRKTVRILDKKIKIPRSLVSFVIVLTILLVLIGVIILIIYKIVLEFRSFMLDFANIGENISCQINDIKLRYSVFRDGLMPEIADFLDGMFNSAQISLTSVISRVTGSTTISAAMAFPQTVFFVIVTAVSTFFFTKDYEKIIDFFKTNLPQKFIVEFLKLRKSVLDVFLKFIKAQLILMSVTFVIVTIFLLAIRVNYAILISLAIGIVDFLPVLGTGAILIPWAIVNAIQGSYAFAIYFMILQLICFLTRQLLEPKVLGKQIGLHPLMVLISAYVGLKFLGLLGYGILGVIVGPVITVMLFSLYASRRENSD